MTAPALSRLPDEQAFCPAHIGWCVNTSWPHVMHYSDRHVHGDNYAWICQLAGDRPHLSVSGVRIDPQYAPPMAHLLSEAGLAELAATVKRLGEIAQAEWVDGMVMNPVTHALETLPVTP